MLPAPWQARLFHSLLALPQQLSMVFAERTSHEAKTLLRSDSCRVVASPQQGPNKMVQTTYPYLFSCNKFSIDIPVKLVPMDQIINKSTLVQITAWHQTGYKPLSEPMMAQFTKWVTWYHCDIRSSTECFNRGHSEFVTWKRRSSEKLRRLAELEAVCLTEIHCVLNKMDSIALQKQAFIDRNY